MSSSSIEHTLSSKPEENGMMPSLDGGPHADLITELKGQVMHVPDMLSLFPSWPSGGRNKYYKRLKTKLDRITERIFPDEQMRKRALKYDFAFFTSTWFPDANWDQLYTCGLFSFWLFHCDDAMDDRDGSVSQDFALSSRYRQQVLDYTRHCLGLGPTRPPRGIISRVSSWINPGSGWNPPSPDLPNTVFKEVGQRIQLATSRVFREMFYKEIKQYIDHCEIEQRERMQNKVSDDLESYLRVRHHTSGVRMYGYITQIGAGMRLPVWMMRSSEMQSLWDEMTTIIIIENDILSLKKELAAGCVHNAVAVMYHQGQPLDSVIRGLVTKLEACRDRFDEIADRVYQLASGASKQNRDGILRYIDGLRTNGTGTIEFCKLAQRYRNEKYFNEDGTMDVVL
ncbi:Presilphiperfolan-8-beta-ol synthase [Madurella mycetomatis]|uniref:Terpene synthase n=1 Tax=Madurella mycetomatis TaxID=100816 RepID=A0A175VT43_9PEZI|nr:Presilphiperfolan-8-beta-ol synthase [Madurella mycetomatis]